jgi:hypothetical protein
MLYLTVKEKPLMTLWSFGTPADMMYEVSDGLIGRQVYESAAFNRDKGRLRKAGM